MARLTAAEVERFKRNTDLVALVRQHGVALKKHGSRDLAGCCPFHAEKTASFIVTPSKNLFHCLGCGAAGGPIDFIMKSQNLPFRAAVSGRGAAPAPADARASGGAPALPVRLETEASAAAENPPVPEERVQVLLERVVTLYTQGFSESKTGRDYLAARGLLDLGLLTRHRVGYANGRLAQVLPTAGPVRRELRTIGILLEGDRERFEGCVVVPVCDEAGRIVTLYGRSTATGPGAEGKRHVYLPNRPKGLWNIAALKGSPHVIAVESILDALSLETAGVANVVAIQGTQGLSEKDLETLKSMGTQRVTLLMDADAAGRAAEERLKEKLANFA